MSSVIVQLAAIAITLHYHTHAVIRSVDRAIHADDVYGHVPRRGLRTGRLLVNVLSHQPRHAMLCCNGDAEALIFAKSQRYCSILHFRSKSCEE